MHFPLGSTLSLVLLKNDPRFPILFHSIGPGNGEEVSKLNLTLFDPGSVVTLPFFFFFYKIKKKKKSLFLVNGGGTCWEMCLWLIRKGKSLKRQPPNFVSALGQENLSFQEGNRSTSVF